MLLPFLKSVHLIKPDMKLLNHVKRITFVTLALSVLAFSSCKPEEKVEKPAVTIEITPAYLEFD